MGCNTCKKERCVTQSCACKIFINSDCLNDVKSVFTCLEIETGLTLTQTLEEMDAQICALFESMTNYFTLINVGAGAGVYKGVNNLGQKEIKSLSKTGDLITINSTTNEIVFSIDEEELEAFVENLIPEICIQSETLAVTEEEGCFNVELQILSDSLVISQEEAGVFRIEQPQTTSIPALYVNSNYAPTYDEWLVENTAQNGGTPVGGFVFIGRGSSAVPFTNSRAYTLGSPLTPPTITPNTAIQNALDGDTVHSYVGSGTPTAPQRQGQQIIVQNNSIGYTFAGTLNYQGLNLKVEGNILSTTTGYVLDLDASPFDVIASATTQIEIAEGILFRVQGEGFNNSGNTEAGSTFATGKVILLRGNGTVYSTTNDITKYLINSDITNSGNNNDGNLTFQIRCNLRAELQGIYRVGGTSRVDFYSSLLSGSITNQVDDFLRAFHQTGGQVRFFESSSIQFEGASVSPRRYAVTFDTAVGGTSTFIGFGNTFGGSALTLFFKENDESVVLEVIGSNSGYGLSVVDIFDLSGVAPWNVVFKNNIFATGSISTADITAGNNISSVNTIGNKVIETLVRHTSKAAAKTAGLIPNSAFTLVQNVNATDLVTGVEYQVVTEGSPSLGTVGDYFVATGTESGTGVARLSRREVLI